MGSFISPNKGYVPEFLLGCYNQDAASFYGNLGSQTVSKNTRVGQAECRLRLPMVIVCPLMKTNTLPLWFVYSPKLRIGVLDSSTGCIWLNLVRVVDSLRIFLIRLIHHDGLWIEPTSMGWMTQVLLLGRFIHLNFIFYLPFHKQWLTLRYLQPSNGCMRSVVIRKTCVFLQKAD